MWFGEIIYTAAAPARQIDHFLFREWSNICGHYRYVFDGFEVISSELMGIRNFLNADEFGIVSLMLIQWC